MGSLSLQPTGVDISRDLNVQLSHMAALVEVQLNDAIQAFERRDLINAKRVIEQDERIDAAQGEIEEKVMELLTAHEPAPDQVRESLMMMKVAAELERIGDMAKNVAKRTMVVSQEKFTRPSSGVASMGRAAQRQFSNILTAFTEKNIDAAIAVWGGDDDLDELYNSVFREILLVMMEEPSRINAGTHLVFIAKNFERVGDHATNIAEALHYYLTGEALAIERPKGDETSVTAITPPSK